MDHSSDIEMVSGPSQTTDKGKSKEITVLSDDDEVAPAVKSKFSRVKSAPARLLETDDLDASLPDIDNYAAFSTQPIPTKKAKRTLHLDLTDEENATSGAAKRKRPKEATLDDLLSDEEPIFNFQKKQKVPTPAPPEEEEEESQPKRPAAKKARTTTDAQAREQKKLEKEAAKEAAAKEKELKKITREDNKQAGSRKHVLHEVRLGISRALAEDKYWSKAVMDKLIDRIEFKDTDTELQPAKHEIFDPPATIKDAKLISWTRHDKKYFSAEDFAWKRYDGSEYHSVPEQSILLFFKATELQTLIAEGDQALLSYVKKIKRAGGYDGLDWQFFIMIEGMEKLQRGERTAENKRWQAERAGEASSSDVHAGGSSKVKAEEIEMQMVKLEIIERCFPIRPNGGEDVARWIFEMSCDIAFRPYRYIERSFSDKLQITASMGDGISKKNKHSTSYRAGLQSMYRIGESEAENLAVAYPSWRALYEAYEACSTVEQKEKMLMGIAYGKKRNGAKTDKVFGLSMSKRIYLQLHSRDPWLEMTKI